MKNILIILTVFVVAACSATSQKPSVDMPTYQYVDNSQITVIVGDNNAAASVATATTGSTPSAVQDTESTTRNSSWVLWLIIGIATIGLGLFVWWKWFR